MSARRNRSTTSIRARCSTKENGHTNYSLAGTNSRLHPSGNSISQMQDASEEVGSAETNITVCKAEYANIRKTYPIDTKLIKSRLMPGCLDSGVVLPKVTRSWSLTSNFSPVYYSFTSTTLLQGKGNVAFGFIIKHIISTSSLSSINIFLFKLLLVVTKRTISHNNRVRRMDRF